MITDFQFFLPADLAVNFWKAIIQYISPQLKRVATLPCEILMSEKQKQPETCIVINYASQRSVST